MPSRSDVDRLRSANADIVRLATSRLSEVMGGLDLTRPERARDALLVAVPAITSAFGEVSATVAADWYDDLRASAPRSGRVPSFSATLAEPVGAEVVAASVRFAAGRLFTDTPAAAGDVLAGAVQRHVLAPGRATVSQSVARDPWRARWARVPSGRACAFCTMLASRGPIYASEESAGGMGDYHDHCGCTATPVWPNDPLPEGYDPDALYADYQGAVDEVGNSSDTPAILAAMRQQLALA